MIYLDHAAATPIDTEVLQAMQPFLTTDFYNPSATYLAARQTGQALESARSSVAVQLGARPADIIFTAGGTESDNLALQGVMRQFLGKNLVVSAVEHEAVLAPAAQFDYRLVAAGADGLVNLDELERRIDDDTVLVSVMYANNEVGSIQPLRRIHQLLTRIRDGRRQAGNSLPLYFHTDACQAANYLDLHVSRLGVDLMTLNGSKIYGPKQSGILYVARHVELQPLIRGGGQERGLRSGTENVAAAIGFATALKLTQESREAESRRLMTLQQTAIRLITEQLPSAIINGSLKHRLPNNIHLTLPGYDNERVLMQLDERGIMAAAGSACSASDAEPSHVLRAMGISIADAQASLRVTMGRSTTEKDIRSFIDALIECIVA